NVQRSQDGGLGPPWRALTPVRRRQSSRKLRSVPHFQLVTVGGEALGAVELAGQDWPPGSMIYRGSEANLRVVDVILDDVAAASRPLAPPICSGCVAAAGA